MIDYQNLKPGDILTSGRIRKFVMFLKNEDEKFLVYNFNKGKIITFYIKTLYFSENNDEFSYKKISILELFKD